MSADKYVKRVPVFEALQRWHHNFNEIKDFVGAENYEFDFSDFSSPTYGLARVWDSVTPTSPVGASPETGAWRLVDETNWVVKHPDGRFQVVKNNVFQEEYKWHAYGESVDPYWVNSGRPIGPLYDATYDPYFVHANRLWVDEPVRPPIPSTEWWARGEGGGDERVRLPGDDPIIDVPGWATLPAAWDMPPGELAPTRYYTAEELADTPALDDAVELKTDIAWGGPPAPPRPLPASYVETGPVVSRETTSPWYWRILRHPWRMIWP